MVQWWSSRISNWLPLSEVTRNFSVMNRPEVKIIFGKFQFHSKLFGVCAARIKAFWQLINSRVAPYHVVTLINKHVDSFKQSFLLTESGSKFKIKMICMELETRWHFPSTSRSLARRWSNFLIDGTFESVIDWSENCPTCFAFVFNYGLIEGFSAFHIPPDRYLQALSREIKIIFFKRSFLLFQRSINAYLAISRGVSS